MNYVVDGLTHRGEGVVRKDGKAVFIPYAVPGEEILIEITKEQRVLPADRLKK
jgi:23S rRNA (uracil1939-C5)-methyltransferase